MASTSASPPREYELRDRGRAGQRHHDAAALAIDSNIAAASPRRSTRRGAGMASPSPPPPAGAAPVVAPAMTRMRVWFPPYNAPAAGMLRAAAALAALAALMCMLPYCWRTSSAVGQLCASSRAVWHTSSAFALFSFWVAFRERRCLHAAAWLIAHALAGSIVGGCVTSCARALAALHMRSTPRGFAPMRCWR
jgi:hypothetical protein